MKQRLSISLVLSSLCATGLTQSIVQQPANQTVVQGGSAAFSVTVSGTGPFRYQWQFNGTNLPSQNIITTIAGNGYITNLNSGNTNLTNIFSGDGGPAILAALHFPSGVAVDGSGDLFISDNNRVREVGRNGIIQTVAGDSPISRFGNGGFGGDGGPATNAYLWGPGFLTVDSGGNIFIADDNNDRVREVDTNGIITTVALVSYVAGVAADRWGNIFISDQIDNCIRRYDTNGVITTVAGNGSAGYSGDGGPATNATFEFDYGGGLTFDTAGNLFVADTWNGCVRRIDTNGIVTTVAGLGIAGGAGNGAAGFSGDGGPATNASFALDTDVAVDNCGNLFIADWGNNRIRKVDTNGIITTVAGSGPGQSSGSYSGDGGPATNANLAEPQAVAVDGVGNLIIADTYNSRIRMVALAGSPTYLFSNVSVANAGQYQVIVTGSSGSVTSSVSTLTVTWPTLISKVVRNGDGSVGLSCLSAPSATNVLYVSGDLSTWQALSTNVAAGNGTWQFTDTNAAGSPARFYRFLTR